jgi:thiamine-phosphate pyrophosphorylase
MTSNTYRILDANANRCSEGLRVLEDTLRFQFHSRELTSQCKELRHQLAAVISRLDRSRMLEARDTTNDLGTSVQTTAEYQRVSQIDILRAAIHRTQQSLRSLEENSKLIDIQIALDFEKLRYLGYTLFKDIEMHAMQYDRQSKLELCSLYCLVDCLDDLGVFRSRLETIVQNGVDVVQVRDKSGDIRRFQQYVSVALEITRLHHAYTIVNDRVDLAMATGADGVHLGQEDMACEEARKICGSGMWIGVSTHSIEQALQASDIGANYIGCGPTFPSSTKSFDSHKGTDWLHQIANQISIPAFAIGGINTANLDSVLKTGIQRIAVSHAIWKSNDPAKECRALKQKLDIQKIGRK